MSTENIKKQFQPLVEFLLANQNKSVKTILDQVLEMTQTKSTQMASYSDENGQVIAIKCYYFKRWMLLDEVEFGTKKHSTTGYNTMCKIGANQWSKQQRDAQKAKDDLLSQVSTGTIPYGELTDRTAQIEVDRQKIDLSLCPKSYDTLEEALEVYTKK